MIDYNAMQSKAYYFKRFVKDIDKTKDVSFNLLSVV